MKKQKNRDTLTVYRSPFCAGYWRDAVSELTDLRVLVFAALIIAIRVALKNVRIPVGESLNVYVGFIFTAVGGTIYGPVVGFIAGIISDLLGFVLASQGGAFNPVYTLIEAFSGFLYALPLYRQKITFGRILLTKASINLIINILCNSIANGIFMGRGVYFYMIPSILKNIVLLPFEVVILVAVFGALIHPLIMLKQISPAQNALQMKKSSLVILCIVTALVLAGAITVAMNYQTCKEAFIGFFDMLRDKIVA